LHAAVYGKSGLPIGWEVYKKRYLAEMKEQKETIDVRRLDTVAIGLPVEDELLVKIDVQGYEDRVILGGKGVLSRASVIIVETSFASLYERQPLFGEVYSLLNGMGFRYHGSLDQTVSSLDGAILQADALFTRDIP